jgi:3'(2'), 5'-bisphosphate nucleotidase
MQPAELERLLEQVAGIARRAGVEILDVYGRDFAVTTKADHSPLTEADLRAHALITRELAKLVPRLPVLSEEASDIAFEERSVWPRYWLVDPLDGTKEFVSRNGEFTVNIALIDGHEPMLGVVYVPVRETLYAGARGCGAYRQVGLAASEDIRTRMPAGKPLRIVGSRSHRGDSLDAITARVGPHELIGVGSSLKFCLIAEGSADFYPRLGPTSEWDTAAAHAVVEAAGGTVRMLNGQPLRYNTKADILNPHFFVAGDSARSWAQLFP